MKNIDIRIHVYANKQGGLDSLLKKEVEKNLGSADIGRLLHEKLGGNSRSVATQYGEFRAGRRILSPKLIPALAEILEVPEGFLRDLNEQFEGRMLLQLDPKLKFKDFLASVPNECETVDKFLIWLATESERRRLVSRL